MTRNNCPRWECLEAPLLPLQIMATNWSPTDEIDTCNSDLIMEIIEVITGNKIPTKNHLISSVDLFSLNPKQLDIKIVEKRYMYPPLHITGRRTEEEGKEP